MAEIGDWRPLRGTHSIQMASLSVTFAESVNDRPWRRIEKRIAESAAKHGLDARQPLQVISMRIQPNAAPSIQPQQEAGFEFLRRASADFFAEKIQVMRNGVTFENWDYTRWAATKNKFSGLVKDAYEIYSEGVELSAISLSYADMFQATTTGFEADCSQIIDQQSRFIAPKAFTKTKPWHTHCGWFEYPDAWTRRLRQVNIDIADARNPDGEFRIANIVTTANDQFGQEGRDSLPAGKGDWSDVVLRLQACHETLKSTLGSILTKEASVAISLKPQ